MRKMICNLLFVFIVISIAGCAYVNVRMPYDDNLQKTDLGTKTGTASAYSMLWLASWGDASYAAAAKNGNISTLKHADQEIQTFFFGLFNRWTVIVYGD